MRNWLCTLALLLCSEAGHATLLELDFENFDNVGLGGGTYDLTMLIDTGGLTSDIQFATRDGKSCLTHFGADLTLLGFSATYNDTDTLSFSGNVDGAYGGSGPPPCNGYFSFMAFETSFGRLSVSYDHAESLTEEDFYAYADPVVAILGLATRGGILAELTNSGGSVFRMAGSRFSVREVPEPATLGLFGASLFALIIARRKRARNVLIA